ncbi:MAG: hypothetical protein J1E02_05275 [Coprobacter sp.]|nr:hypothetical protein [Coprobacter sp.]
MELHSGLFDVPAIRRFVPLKLKPFVLLAFVIVFQFSGGIYLAAVNEMTGSTALLEEDILMAGYASMTGMSLIFAIVFRLKCRFSSRTVFLLCPAMIIAANIVAMTTRSVPVLVATCFTAGFFRMWGTFECNSLLQLWITPKRDFSVFFCYIFLLVQGCISLSGMTHAWLAFLLGWEYIHLFVIGLLLLVMGATLLLFNDRRVMPYIPLYGVDWLGMALWGIAALAILFVCTYGEYYDWFDSPFIGAGCVTAVTAAALNVWRASFIRHPFIANETWRYPIVGRVIVIYVLFYVLISPSHLLEHIYFEGVLDYNLMHFVSLNRAVVIGTVAGAGFTWLTFCRRKWPYQRMVAIAFATVTAYLAICYFTLDYDLPKAAFAVPLFLRGFGYVVIAVALLTAMSPRVPFVHFFQAVTIQNTVSAALAGPIGVAVLEEVLKQVGQRNAMLLGSAVDRVNLLASRLMTGELYGAVQQQALMVSMKEIFGWLTIAGIGCTLVLLLRRDDAKQPERQ